MEIHTLGIDLGKTIFHLVGLNAAGEVVVRKKCSHKQLLQFPDFSGRGEKRRIGDRLLAIFGRASK